MKQQILTLEKKIGKNRLQRLESLQRSSRARFYIFRIWDFH